MNNKSAMIETTTFFLFIFTVFMLYYNMYVVPRDRMLNAVMDCMIENNDMSQDSYTSCHTEFMARYF